MTTPRTIYEIAEELIRNCSEPPEWGEAFQSVKLDTDDQPAVWEGPRWVVIVAKGEHAGRIAAAYDEAAAA